MKTPIISASSYSNTAPLIWSFLYGSMHGKYEMILDTAPARSAQLLAEDKVDAALVPVIVSQMIEGVRLIPDVCVGAREKVRSVCLVTKGSDLKDVESVSLDVSSKTSVVLTKIIFREFLGFEPEWRYAEPDLDSMLSESDCALLIGDPALLIKNPDSHQTGRNPTASEGAGPKLTSQRIENSVRMISKNYRKFDLVELWRKHTGFGFVFAMWMTRRENCDIDFAAARNEGLTHLEEIISNYEGEIPLMHEDFRTYLTENISFSIDDSMQKGLELYFDLAFKHNLIDENRSLKFSTI